MSHYYLAVSTLLRIPELITWLVKRCMECILWIMSNVLWKDGDPEKMSKCEMAKLTPILLLKRSGDLEGMTNPPIRGAHTFMLYPQNTWKLPPPPRTGRARGNPSILYFLLLADVQSHLFLLNETTGHLYINNPWPSNKWYLVPTIKVILTDWYLRPLPRLFFLFIVFHINKDPVNVCVPYCSRSWLRIWNELCVQTQIVIVPEQEKL